MVPSNTNQLYLSFELERIIVAHQLKQVDVAALKGMNKVLIESLPKWHYFNNQDDVDHDVTCIFGIPMGESADFRSILLLQFHKFKPTFCSRKGTSPETLLKELEKLLKNNQLECQCSGGSSGVLKYSKELKDLLHMANFCPSKEGYIYHHSLG